MTFLHHMGLTVSDSQKTVEFFSAVTPVKTTGPLIKKGPAVDAVTGQIGAEVWITFIEFPTGKSLIELAEYRTANTQSINPANHLVGACHPAIVVPDIYVAIDRVTALGYEVTSSPQIASAGPMEGMKYTYVIGPDQIRVELLEEPHP